MVYKYYIKRGNKRFGPYYYRSYRKGNRVVKEYLGPVKHNEFPVKKLTTNPFSNPDFSILIIIFFFLSMTIFQMIMLRTLQPTGKITLQFSSETFNLNETILGNLNLKLREGELIPADSVIRVETIKQVREIKLSDLINFNNSQLEQKQIYFFLEGINLSSQGLGYGFLGTKVTYPEIFFQLGIEKIKEKEQETAQEELYNQTNETQKLVSNKSNLTELELKKEILEQTGLAIFGQDISIIEGSINYSSIFTYQLKNKERAFLIPNSVRTSEKNLTDDNVTVQTTETEVKVRTNYSEKLQGFGGEFLGETKTINLSLSAFNLSFEQEGTYTLLVLLEYQNNTIYSASTEIEVVAEKGKINHVPELIQDIPNINIRKNESAEINLANYFYDKDNDTLTFSSSQPENITITIQDSIATLTPDIEFTGITGMLFFAYDGEETSISNIVWINVSGIPIESVTIPPNITNITLTPIISEQLIQEQAVINQPVKWQKTITLENAGNASIKLPRWAKNITVRKIERAGQEGIGIAGIEAEQETLAEATSSIQKITNETGTEEIEITIQDTADEYIIEYETPSPEKIEQNLTSYKKLIDIGTIYEDLHYENITAYTQIQEIVPLEKKNAISLHRLTETEKEITAFTAYDDNDNGYIDRIEWIVPSLSNQTYEASITIINVQSYPTLSGNWTVYFNTTGEADLTITAIEGTTWNYQNNSCGGETCELRFENIACGETILNHTWQENSADGSNNSVFYSNYSCSEQGSERSIVLRAAKHTLKFQFGSDIAYAYNQIGISGCTNITSSGSYQLTAAITDWGAPAGQVCMNISTSDVELDCQGNWIDGVSTTNTFGIKAEGIKSNRLTNITVRNCNVSQFQSGIYFYYAHNSTIINSNASRNTQYGIYLTNSSNNNITIIDTFSNTRHGIRVENSSFNNLSWIKAGSNTQYGIDMEIKSQYNSLYQINASHNTRQGIYILTNSGFNTFKTINASHNTRDGIYISASENNNFSDIIALRTGNSYYGIYLTNAQYSNFTDVNASRGQTGIRITGNSGYSTFTNVNASQNSRYGILSDANSNSSNFTNVEASGNTFYGIWLDNSFNNTLRNVKMTRANGQGGLIVDAASITKMRNDIDTSNTVNSKEIQYYDGIIRACPDNEVLDYSTAYSHLTLVGCDNVTVRMTADDLICLYSTNNSIIENSNSSLSAYGIILRAANKNNITNVTASNNSFSGIFLNTSCTLNNLTAVDSSGNGNSSIYSYYYSDYNILSKVNASKNAYYGIILESSNYNNLTEIASSENYHGIGLISSTYNSLWNINASWNRQYGVDFYLGTYNNLTNINASYNDQMNIVFQGSSNYNNLTNAQISESIGNSGMDLAGSYNILKNVISSNNTGPGLYLNDANYNTIINVNSSGNSLGIELGIGNGNYYNQIINSTIKDNFQNGLYIGYSSFNNITGCRIENNSVDGYAGIAISSNDADVNQNSSYNRFWNNIINNTPNGGRNWMTAIDTAQNYTNYFNTTKTQTAGRNIIGGPYLAGNYWSDYSGTDADGDGIGDTTYIINATKMNDSLPLMHGALNQPPVIEGISVLPNPGFTDSTLNCSAIYSDVDSDKGNASIYWYNGSELYGFITILDISIGVMISNSTTAGIAADNEIWNCSVNATDAADNAGLPASKNVTIIPHTYPYFTINYPPNASTFANITVQLNATVYDNDLMTVYIYAANNTKWLNTSLVYVNSSVANGTQIIYNLTALPVQPDSSTVLLMHFDNRSEFGENDTNVTDFSWNGNTGTVVGAKWNNTGGKFGGAFQFDGDDDYLAINSNQQLRPEYITVNVWVKPDITTSDSYAAVIGQPYNDNVVWDAPWYSWHIVRSGAGNTAMWRITDNPSSNYFVDGNHSVWDNSEWQMLTLTYDGETIRGYVNGVLDAIDEDPSGPIVYDSSYPDIMIGQRSKYSPGEYYGGLIDEVAIWNRTLSATEIANLYNLTYQKYYWRVNATDGIDENTSTYEFEVTAPPVYDSNISACRNITQAGTYKLNKSITDSSDPDACINISVSDVELDCQGWENYIDGQDTSNTYGIKAEGLSTAKLTNVSVKNCNLTDWYDSTYYRYTENSTLTNTTASYNADNGIYLVSSSNLSLQGIITTNNSWHGVSFLSSNNNYLVNITSESNSNTGIYIESSFNNLIENATANFNSQFGFDIYQSSNNTVQNATANSNTALGVFFDSSNKNQLINSTIKNNKDDGLHIQYSSFNNITGCRIENNSVPGSIAGISIVSDDTDATVNSSYNRIWNNIINNTPNGGKNWLTYGINYTNYFNTTKTLTAGRNIIWGPYLAGNYWSDYTGTSADGDYIGDTAYVINATYMNDSLPLTLTDSGENQAPTIQSVSITPSPAYTNDTLNCTFNITDPNVGDTLKVNITWYKTNSITTNFSWTNDNENSIIVTSGVNGSTSSIGDVEGQNTTHNEKWICQVTAWDGTNAAIVQNSSQIVISNYSTSMAVENDTGKVQNEQVYFYANYTGDFGSIGEILMLTSDIGTAYSVDYADFDCDGYRNQLIIGTDGDLFAYDSNGTQIWTSSTPSGVVDNIVVTAMQSDNCYDDIVVSDSGGYIEVFNKTGEQVWQSISIGYYGIAIAGDFDGQGIKNDIGLRSQYNVTVFNTTNGSTFNQVWSRAVDDGVYDTITVPDINNDGIDDVATTSNPSGWIYVFSGKNGSDIFRAYTVDAARSSNGHLESITAIDLDHENKLDDLIVSMCDDARFAFTWNGTYNSTYNSNDTLFYATHGGGAYDGNAIDLNDSGYVDTFLSVAYSSFIAFDRHNNTVWEYYSNVNTVYNIESGDLYDDGKKEIIIAGEGSYVDVVNTTGSLVFSHYFGLGSVGQAAGKNPATVVGDINKDGIDDIGVALLDGYGAILTTAECNVSFNDTGTAVYSMIWNNTVRKWQYNRTFTNAGDYQWNITCEKAGYTSQIVGENVSIAPSNTAPNVTINFPANASSFTNITVQLNATVHDSDNDNMTVYIFAANNTKWLNTSLVYVNYSVKNNTEIIYNLTALPVQPDANTTLLFHFDNRSDFSENDTFVYDFSGMGNNGNISNGTSATCGTNGACPKWNSTGGKFAGAFEFDGTGDLITINRNSLLEPPNQTTIAVWAYITGEGSMPYADIIRRADGYGYGYYLRWDDEDDLVQLILVRSAGAGGTTYVEDTQSHNAYLNSWHFFLATYNGTDAMLYIDGSEVRRVNSVGYLEYSTSTDFFIMGTNAVGSDNNYIPGKVDEVAIWNRSLTAIEVANLYNLTFQKYYWRVNASDGSIENTSNTYEFTIRSNIAPFIQNITITPSPAYTDSQLNCSANYGDADSDKGNVTITWYNGSTQYSTATILDVVSGQLVSNATLTGIQAEGETWNCTINATDSQGNAGNPNSTIRTITAVNRAPNVTINFPANASSFNNITVQLNATVHDSDNDNMDVYIFAANNTKWLNTSLVYVNYSVKNNTEVIYNLTALPVQPDLSTVLLFHFDNRSEFSENDTNITDFSWNGNTGTVVGANWNATGGKFAGAFEFDGSDDYVYTNQVINVHNFTFGAWVRYEDSGVEYWNRIASKKFVFSDTDGWEITLVDGSDTNIYVSGSSTANIQVACVDNWRDGNWHHVAVVYNVSTAYVYCDGNFKDSGEIAEIKSNSRPLWIGKVEAESNTLWNGTIDEVTIWNRTLSATEIANLYNLTAQKYYWRVNASDGADENSSNTYEFTIDYTPPVITVLFPLNQTYPYDTNQLGFNISLDETGSYCQYSLNGNANASMTADADKMWWNATVAGFQSGSNYAQFYCNDSVNNWNMIGTKNYFSLGPDYNTSACRNITQSGKYTLNKSITDWSGAAGAACINISVSDVEVDCIGNNFWIDGQDTDGIYGIKVEGLDSNYLTNISINNCNLTDWGVGIFYFYSENSTLNNITLSSNDYGIYLLLGSYNNLTNTTLSGNSYGIRLDSASNNNNLANINASSNSVYGIYFNNYVNNNSLINITASDNSYWGIYFSSGDKNQIINSTIRDNKENGIYLSSSSFNNITGTRIENNSVSGYAGIAIESDASDATLNSSYNRFWDNIINNTYISGGKNWNTTGRNYTNYFNTTQTEGTNIIGGSWIAGNWWSDYTGTSSDNDYIGDTPYLINATYMNDSLPLTLTDSYVPNTAPFIQNITITPATAYTNSTLNCSANYGDADGDKGNVTITWYNGETLNGTITIIDVVAGQMVSNSTITGIVTKGETWNCTINATDATGNAGAPNSTTRTISNAPPTNVTLYWPANGLHITTRAPNLTWFNATDIDGDNNITYWVQVDEDSSFVSPEVNGVNQTSIKSGTNISNYTVESDLDIVYGPYYWRVRAYDGSDYSGWSDTWNFTIDSTTIVLVNGTVNFSLLSLGQTYDTSEDNPTPFLVQNDGNVFVNVSVYTQNNLWSAVSSPTDKFRCMAGVSNETDSFNSPLSITSWTNMPIIGMVAISRLNYNNSNDTAELEIEVTVPFDEPPGNKSANIIFESAQA